MNPHQLMEQSWRKSRYSTNSGQCVEIGGTADVAGIRDTKQDGMAETDRPALVVTKGAFASLVDAIKANRV